MASKSCRKYASSIATVTAVTEKLMCAYSERPGCSRFKLDIKKLHSKSCEFLRVAIKGFEPKDIEKVEEVISQCSNSGLDNTRSWSTLISYMSGLLECRIVELNEHNGSEEKKDMAWRLLKMADRLSDHFTSRTKRSDFTDDAVMLVEIFEACWE